MSEKDDVLDYIKGNNPTPTGRAQLLKKVAEATLQDRNKAYGNPEDNFKNIADVWNWWFETRWKHAQHAVNYNVDAKKLQDMLAITPLDVAHMMTLMKMARLKTNAFHLDSMVDAAGYQACAADFKDPSVKLPTINVDGGVGTDITGVGPAPGQRRVTTTDIGSISGTRDGKSGTMDFIKGDQLAVIAGAYCYNPMYWTVAGQDNLKGTVLFSAANSAAWLPHNRPIKI